MLQKFLVHFGQYKEAPSLGLGLVIKVTCTYN